MKHHKPAVGLAILAAALYAVNVPFSKLLMGQVSPAMLAGLLYIGAGCGMGLVMLFQKYTGKMSSQPLLCKADLPYTIAMVLLDIAAPIFLMFGIVNTTSANVSLLNNLEIVFTSLIALVFFKETISPRLWRAILLVVTAGCILGFEGADGFVFNKGSLLVLCACLCWGIENNCTRSISDKNPQQIVVVKGIFSGLGGVTVALLAGEGFPAPIPLLLVLLLGFVSYGLSINFYIMAQKHIGAAKTSAFYAIAPFLGVGFSFVILGERPRLQFYLALALMAVSTVIMVRDTLAEDN